MMFTKRGTGRGYSRQNSYRFSQMGYNSDCEDTQNTNFGMRNMRNTPRFSNVQKQRMNVRAKYNQRGHSNVACYSGRTNKFDNHGQEPYQDCHGHQEPAMDCQDNQNSESSFHNSPFCSSQRYNHNQGYSKKFNHSPNNTTNTMKLQNFKFSRQNEYYTNDHGNSQLDQGDSPPQMDEDQSPPQMEQFHHTSLQTGRFDRPPSQMGQFDHPPPQMGRFDRPPPQLGPFDRPPPKIIRMHHSGVFSVSSKNRPQSPDRDCLPKQEENGMSSSDNKIHAQQDTNDKLWVVDELVFAAIRENYQEDQWETARLAFGQINDMAFKKISTYHCEYCSIRCRTEQDIINHKKTKHHISKREIFFKEWIKTLSL